MIYKKVEQVVPDIQITVQKSSFR
uniref:Uncharacterized protein n=1 Tax=Arundo donax TaxID=35708 RepID=A0A0A9HCV4_ARUDO